MPVRDRDQRTRQLLDVRVADHDDPRCGSSTVRVQASIGNRAIGAQSQRSIRTRSS